MSSRFEFRELHYYADPRDARRYYFVPAVPDLRRDREGRLMFTCLDLGSSGHVMFTATWGASAATVDALRAEIAHGHQAASPAGVTVSFAPLSSPACHVLFAEDGGTLQTIATSATSGVPPYDALFNLAVPLSRLRTMARAFQGTRGLLAIEYVATLPAPATASATFRSQARDLLPLLRGPRAGTVAVRTLLEQAIDAGLATVTVEVSPPSGRELALDAFERVLEEAAALVPRWITEAHHGGFDVVSTIERDLQEPIRVFADIGDIVAGTAERR